MGTETADQQSSQNLAHHNDPSRIAGNNHNILQKMALGITDWSERWYPDAFIFGMLAVFVVTLGCLAIGASFESICQTFGGGFWTLIPFTMQVAFGVITGFVLAHSKPASWLIARLALVPKTGRGAVAYVALFSMTTALLSWTVSVNFSGLLARQLARRQDLRMDYRAAGAAGYLGIGATWALGMSSAAAQIQANPASLPKSLFAITGLISFRETVFLWQSIIMAFVLIIFSVAVAYLSAPGSDKALTADDLGVSLAPRQNKLSPPCRPGEWLEYSPALTIFVSLLGAGYLVTQFISHDAVSVLSNLNTYNFSLLLLGLLFHWRPRSFLNAVSDVIPAIGGVLIQFPLYGSVGAMLVEAKGLGGLSLGRASRLLFCGTFLAQPFRCYTCNLYDYSRLFHAFGRRKVGRGSPLLHACGKRSQGAPGLDSSGI